MKRSIIFLSIALMSFFACKNAKHTCEQQEAITPLPPYSSSTDAAMPFSIVQGKVTGPDKVGIAYATIVAKNQDGKVFGTYTDENGFFKIEKLPLNTYTINVTMTGFVNQTFGPLKIEKVQNIVFELIETEEIKEVLLKPVIYLYPTAKTEVHVSIAYDGQLIHTYPRYPEHGWQITVFPDGTLIDASGRSYYALYWEGNQNHQIVPHCGQVVAGDESISFLEKHLSLLGLNEREANEFIMYWLPQLENNPYNLIHFSTDQYNHEVPLNITPLPDQMIRIMMTTIPLKSRIDYPLQVIEKNTTVRNGFTVVEWGGTVMSLEEVAE